MDITAFPPSVIERVGYYVYTLADPEGKVFYVGKGQGNRVFAHVSESLANPSPKDKLATIREIHERGGQVRHEIVRHGLDESAAFEVESALIDYIGLDDLTNEVAGAGMEIRGRMTLAEIVAAYSSPPIIIVEPSLLIIVNRLFERNIDAGRLYEITRGNWVLGTRRNRATFALSVFRGVVRQVYRIRAWNQTTARSATQKVQVRWRFDGEVATDLQHYVGGNVATYIKRGAQSPTKYLNC